LENLAEALAEAQNTPAATSMLWQLQEREAQ